MNQKELFVGKSDNYAKYRPSYPKELILAAMKDNPLPPGAKVADIGSGTGILTRLLLDCAFQVYAVEPNDEMRMRAEKELADYETLVSLSGSAEDTGLSSGTIDFITAAQSFHWFDKDGFRKECKRIGKQDVTVMLMWNSRDPKSAFVEKNAQICKLFCPNFRGFSGGVNYMQEDLSLFFRDGIFETLRVDNPQYYDLSGFIGRNLSASYSLTPSDTEYQAFVAALTTLFTEYASDGIACIPHYAYSYWGKV